MNRAVFLDRDGTINIEKEYLFRISEFEFIPGAIGAIKELNAAGFKVIIITNQSGIAKGYYGEKDLEKLHNWMEQELKKHGAVIDDIYYCPHHNEYGTGIYKQDCTCRKPKPGMLLKAVTEHDIVPGLSYTVGDRESDIIAGKRAGTKTILVGTGYAENTSIPADYFAPDIKRAIDHIITSGSRP